MKKLIGDAKKKDKNALIITDLDKLALRDKQQAATGATAATKKKAKKIVKKAK